MCWVIPPASPAATAGLADRVEQRGLAVVDVAHDRDHGRAGDEVLRLRLDGLDLDDLLLERLDGRLVAELARDLDRELGLEALVDRGHDPARDERLHHVARLDVRHLLRELLDGDALGERDLAGRPAVARLLLPLDARRGVLRLGARGRASDGPHGPGRAAGRSGCPGRVDRRPAAPSTACGERGSGLPATACGLVGCGPTGRGGAIGPQRAAAAPGVPRRAAAASGRAGRRAAVVASGADAGTGSRDRGAVTDADRGRGRRRGRDGPAPARRAAAAVTVVRTGPAGAAAARGAAAAGRRES